MRAYKTVNDSYIEPISFTVPRRAETFQSDIYPPAFGNKPAMSAQEWLGGKTAVPPKIDLESVYDGNAPVEVPSDFKPPVAAPVPTPAPAAKPAPSKEPEAKPIVAARGPPPRISDQQTSISAMANKFQDGEDEEGGREGEKGAETSSFEEVSRPAQRTVPVRVAEVPKLPSPLKPTPASSSPVKSPEPSPLPRSPACPAAATAAGARLGLGSGAASSLVESSLEQIKHMLEQQTRIIAAQSEQLTVQSDTIGRLAAEVETLKKRVGASASAQDQSERIRQLELELEEARS